nr:hypothetical protein [Tanacetum cinerariifolium]
MGIEDYAKWFGDIAHGFVGVKVWYCSDEVGCTGKSPGEESRFGGKIEDYAKWFGDIAHGFVGVKVWYCSDEVGCTGKSPREESRFGGKIGYRAVGVWGFNKNGP